MRRANLFSVDTAQDDGDPKGYEVPYARIGELIGAARMGLSVYDLAPGNSICPYHWEFPDEEWLIVLAGRPTLRIPDGEHELEAGDVVCFPPGPDGAHKVTNKGEEPVRVAMLSTKAEAGYAVYPDSNKQNVFPLRKIHRIDDAVDYWDGEL
jgi:uncharacterized cupin superfamily protein